MNLWQNTGKMDKIRETNMTDLRTRIRRLNLPETVRTLRAIEQDLSDEGDAKGMRTIRALRLICQDELRVSAEMPS